MRFALDYFDCRDDTAGGSRGAQATPDGKGGCAGCTRPPFPEVTVLGRAIGQRGNKQTRSTRIVSATNRCGRYESPPVTRHRSRAPAFDRRALLHDLFTAAHSEPVRDAARGVSAFWDETGNKNLSRLSANKHSVGTKINVLTFRDAPTHRMFAASTFAGD